MRAGRGNVITSAILLIIGSRSLTEISILPKHLLSLYPSLLESNIVWIYWIDWLDQEKTF